MANPLTTTPSFKFNVRRSPPELVPPALPTPHELKPVSNIDDQQGLRFQIPGIQFYRGYGTKMGGRDPIKVIKEALAKVLVFYYPFAGRLREELPSKKLLVDCTAEGIIFIEAEADITLEKYLEFAPIPPFPNIDELLYDVPGSDAILDSPLLLIQVTRLLCGGFIFAIRLNHVISDALGIVQFMKAVGEMARDATTPSILPVWERELLLARDPPRVTCTHPTYEEVADDNKGVMIPSPEGMVLRCFFFGTNEMSALRTLVPEKLQKCSKFEVLTASLWKCRTIALKPKPDEYMRIILTVNARNKFNPPLPVGYYGNCFGWPMAVSTARELCEKPLCHALELVTKAKNDVNEEYMRSVVDLMAIKGRPHFTLVQIYLVSDVTRVGLQDVDFGWGEPVYSGPAHGVGRIPHLGSFYIPFTKKNGESGTVVPICLPHDAMETFTIELSRMVKPDIL